MRILEKDDIDILELWYFWTACATFSILFRYPDISINFPIKNCIGLMLLMFNIKYIDYLRSREK